MKSPPNSADSAQAGRALSKDGAEAVEAGEERVIPLVQEEVTVGKRIAETGGVRVHKHVDEREEQIEVLLEREDVEVERVVVNRPVERAPQVRQEGDTIIVPLCEEVLVTEKRIVLKEEVRIRRRSEQSITHEKVLLRSERATVAPLAGATNEEHEPRRTR